MNSLWVHLATSHIPVIGIPLATLLLVWGLLSQSDDLKRGALWLLVFMGLLTPVISQSGEAAEERLENEIPAMVPYIEKHEEAAESATVAAVGLGAFSGLLLLFHRFRRRWLDPGPWLVAVAAIALSAWLGWVAHLGGLIGHDNIRPGSGQTLTPSFPDK